MLRQYEAYRVNSHKNDIYFYDYCNPIAPICGFLDFANKDIIIDDVNGEQNQKLDIFDSYFKGKEKNFIDFLKDIKFEGYGVSVPTKVGDCNITFEDETCDKKDIDIKDKVS